MKTGTRVALIALAGAVVVLLSGCVRFPADLTTSPVDMLNVSSISAHVLSHPGPVNARTPQSDTTRVVWTTGSTDSAEVHEVTSKAPVGPPDWVWVVVELGVLIALGVLVVILLISFRGTSVSTDDDVEDQEIS